MTRGRLRRFLSVFTVVVALTAALGLWGVAPASANALDVRTVDTSAFPDVKATILVSGQSVDASAITLQENGRYVQTTSAVSNGRSSLPIGLVLVIDTSASMVQLDRLNQAKLTARRLIAAKRPSDQMAIVGFGTTAVVLQALTTDNGALEAAVAQLSPLGNSALYDGVRIGAGQLAGKPDLLPRMIIITDGRDVGSTGTFDVAQATALSSKAQVMGIGLSGAPDFESTSLKSVASATGGSFTETSDPARLADIAARLHGNLANEYVVTYRSSASAPFDLAVSAGGLVAAATHVTPKQLEGSVEAPDAARSTRSLGPLRSSFGAVLVALLIFLALGLGALALLELIVPDRSGLDTTLGSYTLDAPPVEEASRGSILSLPILKRAVALTERLGHGGGALSGLETRLEQADLNLRAGEVALFTLVGAVVLGIVGSVLGNPVVGLLLLLLTLVLPVVVLNTLAARRRRRFTSQLPDMLNLLAAVLRSGYAIVQGLDAVSKEVGDPMGGELRRVLAEARLGRDVTEALADCAVRMQSADFDWAVLAIGIQREVGGNLAELLSTVAETMVQRERLRRDVKSLTAEGRMSVYVLGLLTPGVGVMMYLLNPEYIQLLFDETLGQILLGGSTLLAVFGFWWMNKIIQVDI